MLTPLLATTAISLISLSGGIFLLQKKIQHGQTIHYFVSFAAGVMLAAALLDLLPEALEKGQGSTIQFVLWGIVFSFLFERFILWHHHHEEKHHIKPSAFLILVGDAIHNFVDGVVIAASFLVNPVIGFTTTLAIAAHEIPQELADFSILVYAGFTPKKALLFNFLSALTAIAGTVVGFYFLVQYEHILPVVLSFTAGLFIYIACADLIPELHSEHAKKDQFWHTVPFIVGIVLMKLLTSLFTE